MRTIILTTALLILVIVVNLVFRVLDERQTLLEAGERQAENIAQVLDEHAKGLVNAVDLTLITMQRDRQNQMTGGHTNAAVAYQLLSSRLKSLPYVFALYTLDANGKMLYDTFSFPAASFNASEREYFLVHRNEPEKGLYIGPPTYNQAKKVWLISFSRRVSHPDGSFAGVMVAAIDPNYIQQFYDSINAGKGSSLSLGLIDGTLIARSPVVKDQFENSSSRPRPLYFKKLSSAKIGTFHAASVIDGEHRILSYRVVKGTPLVVQAGLSESDVLAVWQANALRYGLTTTLFLLIVAFLIAMIYRELQRRESMDQILRENENRMRIIVNNFPGTLAHVDKNLRYQFVNARYATEFGVNLEDVFGRPVQEVIGSELTRTLQPHLDKVLAGEAVYFDFSIQRGDKLLYRAASLIPDIKPDGSVPGYFSCVMDITDRKTAELKLQDRERQLQVITDSFPGHMTHVDSNLCFRYVNAKYAQDFGLSREEIIGRPIEDIVGSDIFTSGEPYRRKVLAGERVTYEVTTQRGGHKVYWVGTMIPDIGSDGIVRGYFNTNIDISESRKTEMALQDSERQLTTIADNFGGMISRLDKDLRFVFVNSANEEFFRKPREQLTGSLAADILSPEGFSAIEPYWRRALAGERVSHEQIIVPPDGKEFCVLFTEIPDIAPNGEVQGIFSSAVNITQIKQAEAAIKSSEQRFRMMFENSPLPMWIFDLESLKFLDVNEVTCTQYGYSRDEFMGMTILDVRPEEDIPIQQADLQKIGLKPHGHAIRRHRKKDGTIIYVDGYFHLAQLAGKNVHIVCPVDVTKKVEAEEAIKLLNARLEQKVEARTRELIRKDAETSALMDSAPQIIWFADVRGKLTYVNRTWHTIFAGESEKLPINSAQRHEKFDAMEAQFFNNHIRGALNAGQAFQGEALFPDKFDDYRTLYYSGVPVSDGDGQLFGWVGIHTDITEQKQAEESLRAVNRELEAYTNRAVHDLRAPLLAIKGFSTAVQEDYGALLDDQGRHYLSRISSSASAMGHLIDGTLQLAQMAKLEIDLTEVNISAVARSVMSELYPMARERKYQVHIQNDMQALADSRLMRILLDQLLGNAWKYTSKQPLTIIEFGMNTDASGNRVFHLKDNGAGFDPAYSSKLFKEFERLHSASEFPGSGIGLALVQRVIDRHGGKIWAESQPERGATFFFTLSKALN